MCEMSETGFHLRDRFSPERLLIKFSPSSLSRMASPSKPSSSGNAFVYRVVQGVYLAGSLQYLVNPDDINRPRAPRAPRDALVVGIKLAVNVGDVLGLPSSLALRK